METRDKSEVCYNKNISQNLVLLEQNKCEFLIFVDIVAQDWQ